MGIKLQLIAEGLSDLDANLVSGKLESAKSCIRLQRPDNSILWDLYVVQDPSWQHDLLTIEACSSFALALNRFSKAFCSELALHLPFIVRNDRVLKTSLYSLRGCNAQWKSRTGMLDSQSLRYFILHIYIRQECFRSRSGKGLEKHLLFRLLKLIKAVSLMIVKGTVCLIAARHWSHVQLNADPALEMNISYLGAATVQVNQLLRKQADGGLRHSAHCPVSTKFAYIPMSVSCPRKLVASGI